MLKYFSKDYVIPSPKVNEDQKKRSSAKIEFGEDQKKNYVKTKKKVFAGNCNVFSSKLGEDQNKKVFADSWSVFPSKSIFPRNFLLLGRNL